MEVNVRDIVTHEMRKEPVLLINFSFESTIYFIVIGLWYVSYIKSYGQFCLR